MRIVLKLPQSLDSRTALAFSMEMGRLKEASEFIFDFRAVQNTEPFGMLMFSGEIRNLIDRFPNAKFSSVNYEHVTYAAHMGFFQHFGVEFGARLGTLPKKSAYLPLTLLDCEDLRRKAIMNGNQVGDEVEGESQHLARMLCGEESGDIFDTLSYSMREMMRNVVEHSEAKRIGLCAQYWPTKNKVEVAIIDRGIGTRKSLSDNPHIDTSSDKAAINHALMPAISGKAFKGAKQKKKGQWANSGFGLYMTNRLCRNGGSFLIASGDTGMLLTATAGKRYFECSYQGTAIRLVINTGKISDLKGSLQRYRDEGFEFQQRYRELIEIDPSAASLMLSKDFDMSLWRRILGRKES